MADIEIATGGLTAEGVIMARKHRLITPFALAIAVGVTAVPAASARPIEVVSNAPAPAQASQNTRSLPAMDAATASQTGQDARSLPAMDAATAAPTTSHVRSLPAMDAATAAVPVAAPSVDGGDFDWGDAGIGASGLLGLALISAGGVALVSRRRGHSVRRSGTSAVTG